MRNELRNRWKLAIAVFTVFALLITVINASPVVEAASVRLNTKTLSMKKGSTKILRLKGAKKAKWSVVSGKKIIHLEAKKGTSVRVVAKGKGTAKIRCMAAGKKMICTVKVSGKKVASDGASMQRNNPDRPTRVLKKGTKINMYFGKTVIPGMLNDSKAAKDLIAKLPYTVEMSRYSHDFCGVMDDPLKYDKKDVHYGWLNGDIDFSTDGPYFTILFDDEKVSESYGHQVNIGVITCDLSKIRNLKGDYNVRIRISRIGG